MVTSSADRANAAAWQRPRLQPQPIIGTRLVSSSGQNALMQQHGSGHGSGHGSSHNQSVDQGCSLRAWNVLLRQHGSGHGSSHNQSVVRDWSLRAPIALMQQHGSGHGSGHGSSHNQSVDQGCSLRAWNVHNFYITSDDTVVIARSRVLAAAAASTSPQPRGRHATPLPPEGTSSRPDHGRGLQFM